jgi:hypothetical protein
MTRIDPRVLFGALALILSPIAPAEAQDRNRPPGPVMLRRIAEALDGHRNGDRVWVVSSFEPPFPVLGVFANEREAAQRARTVGPSATYSGPYLTERDPGSIFITGCVHITSSRMHRELCVPPVRGPVSMPEIRSMTLVITKTNGVVDSIPVARDADAIFLTLPAIDKFAVPYYTGVIGLAATSDLRREVARAFTTRPAQRGTGGSER